MNLRLILKWIAVVVASWIGVSVAAAVAGGVFAWLLYTLVAGGGSDTAEAPGEDPRTQYIVSFIPLQVEKLGVGAAGIYGVMDFGVQAECSLEEFVAVMADEPPSGAFREIKDINYNDDGTADVTIVLIEQSGDVEVTWKLSFIANGRPKILALPGSEECTPG